MLGRIFILILWLSLGAAFGFFIAPQSHQRFEFISMGMLVALACAHLISGWHAENFLTISLYTNFSLASKSGKSLGFSRTFALS